QVGASLQVPGAAYRRRMDQSGRQLRVAYPALRQGRKVMVAHPLRNHGTTVVFSRSATMSNYRATSGATTRQPLSTVEQLLKRNPATVCLYTRCPVAWGR